MKAEKLLPANAVRRKGGSPAASQPTRLPRLFAKRGTCFPSARPARAALILVLACGLATTSALADGAGSVPVELERQTFEHGGRERGYRLYRPRQSDTSADLILALHGARGDGQRLRAFTGYGIERLAERQNLVVVYPDAFGGSWNDCRTVGEHPAKQLDVDDVGFIEALASRVSKELGLKNPKLFALGFSNGGHMAFRLALERPRLLAGTAAIGAHLPPPAESICPEPAAPVPTLLISGTADPINPFEGGRVELTGQDLGAVLSARETFAYLRRRWGIAGEEIPHRYREGDGDPTTYAESLTWVPAEGAPLLKLVVVYGGGHTIPGSPAEFPAFLGAKSREIDAVEEIGKFFAQLRGHR